MSNRPSPPDLLEEGAEPAGEDAIDATAASLAPIPSAELQRFMEEEIERFRSLVITALPMMRHAAIP